MKKNEVFGELTTDEVKEKANTFNVPDEIIEKRYQLEIERLTEELEGLRQDRKQRKTFAYVIFGLVCIYILAIVLMVAISSYLQLSDRVLIVMLSTTTANVIGIFAVITRYLFHFK